MDKKLDYDIILLVISYKLILVFKNDQILLISLSLLQNWCLNCQCWKWRWQKTFFNKFVNSSYFKTLWIDTYLPKLFFLKILHSVINLNLNFCFKIKFTLNPKGTKKSWKGWKSDCAGFFFGILVILLKVMIYSIT